MKKYLTKIAVLCGAVAFMASCCASDESAVKKSAEGFLKALVAGDLAGAKEFTTVATQEKWGDFTQFVSEQMAPEIKQAIASMQVNVSEVKVDGDNAEVVCSATIPYLLKQITVLHLVKVDGKWLINEPDAIVLDTIHIDETVTVLDVDSASVPAAAKPVIKPVIKN